MKQLNFKHIRIIAKYHMRFSLRNGSGIVFLLLTLTTALIVASMFIAPVESMVDGLNDMDGMETQMTAGEMINEIGQSEEAESAVDWLVGADSEGKFLLRDKPALLSCIMLIILMLLPYLVSFGAFNQFSGDIANRGLRFILLRSERINIYLGRFVGTVFFCLITVVMSLVLLVLYIQFKLGVYQGIDLWVWGLQGIVAFFLLCLPFVALCSWISGSIDSPFGSLTLCLLTVGFPGLLLMMMNIYAKKDFFDKFWPTGWKYGILNSNFGTVALSAFILLAFTAFFLFIGLRSFQKRDL